MQNILNVMTIPPTHIEESSKRFLNTCSGIPVTKYTQPSIEFAGLHYASLSLSQSVVKNLHLTTQILIHITKR